MEFEILRAFKRVPDEAPWDSERPIREALLSAERLQQHAQELATAQTVAARPVRRPSLVARLRENEAVLLQAYRSLAQAVDAGRSMTPAAEWLLDNYHVVDKQMRDIRTDLPASYYRQLPKLASGPLAGYPRIFGVAWSYVAHTDSHFDPEVLCRFVRAYQRVQPLMIGELWALAITLRIVLVENLRRQAQGIMNAWREREEADALADRILGIGAPGAGPRHQGFQTYEQAPLPRSFVVQLLQRLRNQEAAAMGALLWLEERLAAQGTGTDRIVQEEHQEKSAKNVTVRNIITSMRLISDVDWVDLFERISLVDDVLQAACAFRDMDFRTRNLYRSAIEELARGAKRTELEIAQAAVRAAQAAPAAGDGPRRRQGAAATPCREHDPGYYLIAGGRRAFETTLGFRLPWRAWPRRLYQWAGIGSYVGGVLLVAVALLAGPGWALRAAGIDAGALAGLLLLGLIPAIDAAVALVNRVLTSGFGATLLPGLELREGVPAHLRTMVVVPTLLTTPTTLEEQLARLETHYLSCPEEEVHYALLSDWTDAASEMVEGDEALLQAAIAGIALLNQRHGPAAGGARFLLLHRRRLWNASQGRWIGWERKRGKLDELNRLLRGETDTTFMALGGRPPVLPAGVRYVITLDADTRLPQETVRRLIGKMAHPLNQPRFDPASRRVVEGYGVLQPRVTPSLPSGCEGSLFQRTFSGPGGIDPYAAAASDVYQDLFGEGSYTGKGIYDVDAFHAALDGRVPENALLSHDLFEGTFARAGLVSDIEVVEEFPARYDVAAARQHRWARGDWQLLPWIVGGRPSNGRRPCAPPLIGRWKMLDNLRRSLSAPASLAALLAGWLLPLPAALGWTAFLVLMTALPPLLPVVAAALLRPARVTARSYLRSLAADLGQALAQTVLLLVLLAHQAWLMADAIGRTLYRLFVSHRHLLDWVTAAQAKVDSRLGLTAFYRRLGGAVVIALLAATMVEGAGGAAWAVAAPFLVAWLLSPAIARWVSLPLPPTGQTPISAAEARALRLVARRTWRFFETFVTAQDHMLAPDNFQEDPTPALAHRTSPTNLGLYLLSAVSARDFAWAGTAEIADRLEATLATMERLPRFRGHFYNWYDTRALQPLAPRYVSSVDSGNLAGHLLALANACRAWADRPLAGPERLAGIEDGLLLTREAWAALPEEPRRQAGTQQRLGEAIDALAAALRPASLPAAGMSAWLRHLAPQLAGLVDLARMLADERADEAGADLLFWAAATQRAAESHLRDLTSTGAASTALAARLAALETRARALANAMEFGFLFDPQRKLLAIGYRVEAGERDPSCYDLLASEARLASFVAIAKGDVPPRHWFRLGRAVTPVGFGVVLISWSGSMFEYLMPALVMGAPDGSLLDQTGRLIVRRQIAYGQALGVPWGISESAYGLRDQEATYQYSNFGVPGLGLKRGLGENTVVAPYATALAAMVDASSAVRNFDRLLAAGGRGRHGFYEALDYTPARLPEGADVAVIRTYMAHHQGMTVVAMANVLLDGAMRQYFHGEPCIQATELLLHERPPRYVGLAHPQAESVKAAVPLPSQERPVVRRLHSAHGAAPEVQLLSNGRYTVMLTAAASGYSRWGESAITRWHEDATRDDWGSYLYLRDVHSGAVWSAGYQPSGVEPDSYEVTFNEERAEFVRRDGALTTRLNVVVSAEDDVEVRRVSLSNGGDAVRDIELTSYAELVLAPPAADTAHPAFSKLFVQTECLAGGVILATRRRRSPADPEIWAAHLAVVQGEALGEPEFETDRARFLGRGRDSRAPLTVTEGLPLSNTVGTVLDPIFALRRRVRLAPGKTVHVAWWTIVASSRAALLELVDKHRDATAFDRVATLAWTRAQVQLSHLGIDAGQADLFQCLAGHVLYANPALRPLSATALAAGNGGPPAFWALGISGDLPIVLVCLDSMEEVALVRQLLCAQEYWRLKQLAVDLVIVNERFSSYFQDLQSVLETLVRSSPPRWQRTPQAAGGAVFVLRADQIASETRALLQARARVVLLGRSGALAEQLKSVEAGGLAGPPAPRRPLSADGRQTVAPSPELEFFNGLGGFAARGREYVTLLGAERSTPAPWINVIANPVFGFQVAAEGSGYSWALNSRENQLTPWSNDPVSDRPGEVFYLRDEESGELWGPTALPIRDEAAPYSARHGQGYSRFEHTARGVALELLQYVPLADPVKISRLTIRNLSGRPRRLSLTAYVEWVLGAARSAAALSVVTEIDAPSGALLARNPWNTLFGARVAFADLGGRQTAWTGDRGEFLGRHGTLDNPAALGVGVRLSQRVGAGLDPCGALQTRVELAPGEAAEIVFFLGETATVDEARTLIARYRAADLEAVLRDVMAHWEAVLGAVEVATPDRALDIMLNHWLLYQALACRLWARAGFYQASGAYGFRDQLQDSMALILARPALAREHLLRAAARQFVEGDVQHWWLPPAGQGVRTRNADDRVWLAYTAAHYVEASGDLAVLDEPVPFLAGEALKPGETEAYFQPRRGEETASLFEHCARALDRSLAVGAHGLPLFGSGDWNDSMNRVGEQGESVWLGWFLYATLAAFVPLAQARQEQARAARWRAHMAELQTALERDGWDGNWYRRGYFADGTPLGSSSSAECRIDAIAQSWSVLSGAAEPERARRAMAAVEVQLVRAEEGLALLFTPPFEHTPLDPGYVKGYPPGVRENGGQYTHAAAWSVMALAALGQGDKAAELFALVNPINHASTQMDVQRYKVEPYVAAADVYSVPPHVGRGGWTWYTGSAGWLYRAGMESILGLRLRGAFLLLSPCIPREWPRFEVRFRYRSARYDITVENPDGVCQGVARAELDGRPLPERPPRVPLADDGGVHAVRLVLG